MKPEIQKVMRGREEDGIKGWSIASFCEKSSWNWSETFKGLA